MPSTTHQTRNTWTPFKHPDLTREQIECIHALSKGFGKEWLDSIDEYDFNEMMRLVEKYMDLKRIPDLKQVTERGSFDEERIPVLPDHACLYRSLLVLMIKAVCQHDISAGVITEERFKRYVVLVHLCARVCVRDARRVSTLSHPSSICSRACSSCPPHPPGPAPKRTSLGAQELCVYIASHISPAGCLVWVGCATSLPARGCVTSCRNCSNQ